MRPCVWFIRNSAFLLCLKNDCSENIRNPKSGTQYALASMVTILPSLQTKFYSTMPFSFAITPEPMPWSFTQQGVIFPIKPDIKGVKPVLAPVSNIMEINSGKTQIGVECNNERKIQAFWFVSFVLAPAGFKFSQSRLLTL